MKKPIVGQNVQYGRPVYLTAEITDADPHAAIITKVNKNDDGSVTVNLRVFSPGCGNDWHEDNVKFSDTPLQPKCWTWIPIE